MTRFSSLFRVLALFWHCLALFGTVWPVLPNTTIDLRVILRSILRSIWGTSEGHLGGYLGGSWEGAWEGARRVPGEDPGSRYTMGWALAILERPEGACQVGTTPGTPLPLPTRAAAVTSPLQHSAQRLRLPVKTPISGSPIYQATIGSANRPPYGRSSCLKNCRNVPTFLIDR